MNRTRTAVLLVLMCLSGCGPIRRHITNTTYQRSDDYSRILYQAQRQLTMDAEQFEQLDLPCHASSGRVQVKAHRRLEDQSQCIAEHFDGLIKHLEQTSNIKISYDTITVYLLRFDHQPENFQLRAPFSKDNFPVVLFTTPGQSCQEIMASNLIWPYAVIHELVELSMVDEPDRIALLDVSWNWLMFRVTIANHTRWFRDGLASYLGYLAHNYSYNCRCGPAENTNQPQTAVHQRPFSSLAKVKTDVLRWTFVEDEQLTADYYNASLGIFLLIEQRFGPEAIAKIIERAYQLDYPDGQALMRITNEVIDDDLEKLIDDFRFPYTGMELQNLSKASALNHGYKPQPGLLVADVADKSAAKQAKIGKNAVITAVNGQPVANVLQFQLLMLQAAGDNAVELTILKEPDSPPTSVSVPIQYNHHEQTFQKREKGSASRTLTLRPLR